MPRIQDDAGTLSPIPPHTTKWPKHFAGCRSAEVRAESRLPLYFPIACTGKGSKKILKCCYHRAKNQHKTHHSPVFFHICIIIIGDSCTEENPLHGRLAIPLCKREKSRKLSGNGVFLRFLWRNGRKYVFLLAGTPGSTSGLFVLTRMEGKARLSGQKHLGFPSPPHTYGA